MNRPRITGLAVCLCGLAFTQGCDHLKAQRDPTPCTAYAPCQTCVTPELAPCAPCPPPPPAQAIAPKAVPLSTPAPLPPSQTAPVGVERLPPLLPVPKAETPRAEPTNAAVAASSAVGMPALRLSTPAPAPAAPVARLSFSEIPPMAVAPCLCVCQVPVAPCPCVCRQPAAPCPCVCQESAVLAPRAPGPPAATLFPPKTPLFGEPDSSRKSFVDLTAAPCFGHAPDFSWLSGQVEYSRIKNEWRLRYASVDETDRYGGRVILIENAHAGYLSDGQYVRVRGRLVNPQGPAGSPAYYRIEGFKVIDHPHAGPPTAE